MNNAATNKEAHDEADGALDGCTCRTCERLRRWEWEDHMDAYEDEVRAHGGTVES